MGYDEVITYLGDFGRYQKQVHFLLCLPAICCAFHKLAGVFLLSRPNFRCELPFERNNTNVSYNSLPAEYWELSYPKDAVTNKYQTCEYYDVNYTQQYLNGTVANVTAQTPTVACQRYLYDPSKYLHSAVTEWNMVCSRAILTATSDSIFMVGVLLGSVGFGHLSDKYGRKLIFFISLVLQVTFGLLTAFAPDYVTYTLSRMLIGATTSGVFMVAYVLALENVGSSYRLFAGVGMQMCFSVGFLLTAGFAYFIQEWRMLQLALSLPGLLFLWYYCFIPESTRWLLLKNRKAEAIEIIEHAAKVNKVRIPMSVYNNLIDESNERVKAAENVTVKAPTVLDLLRFPNIRRRTLLIWFDWFVSSGTYYALSWNTNSLGDNYLLNFMISGAVEFPAYIFLLFTLNRCGRRTILCGCMLLAGTSLILTVVVPNNLNWLIITLAMLGKMAVTGTLGTVYIFSVEQFPTVVRNVGLGASSMMARFGGILVPYINMLEQIWRPLPLIICGVFVFTAGLLSLSLPETHNKPLPETIADGERFGQKESSRFAVETGEELKSMMPENGTMH